MREISQKRWEALQEARTRMFAWDREGLIRISHSRMTTYSILRRLFNVRHIEDIPVESLRALAGVHGYAYFKMLLARGKNTSS